MMVKVEDISSIKKKLSFEVAAEHVDAEIKKAYQKIAKTAKVKGFRPGKVPWSVLEKYYAPQMEEQVLGRLINDSYFKALVDHRIAAVSEPEIVESSPLEKGKPFTYEAQVEVKPDIQVKDYTGLTLQKEKIEFNDQIVEGRLEELRGNKAEMKVSSREEARLGDFVTIDFDGFVDNKPFEGGKAEDYVLELGSGSFIPGFEEKLEGLRHQEEREIEVTFPDTYGKAELASKQARFKVVLKEIKEKVLPELDDKFAKEFGFESLAELKGEIGQNYKKQENNRIEGDLRERLVDALVERNPIEVPEAMVANQLDYMLGIFRDRLKSQGMTLEMLGMNEDSFKQIYRQAAVRQIQGSLILEAVARQENIKVEDSEIDEKLAQIAEMSHSPLEFVKKRFGGDEARKGLILQITEEKVMQFLLDKSIIQEVDKTQLASKSKEDEKE
jgi:trigger factor